LLLKKALRHQKGIGEIFFVLANHLGNVLVTVTDKKTGVSTNGTTVSYYNADVVSANDYYPGGMQMVGRTYSASSYRYGFNGKEMDNEVKGTGNSYDYGERIYDPRVVRFLSVDPLTKGYPMLTPYQFASNSPISGIDLDGLEYYTIHVLIQEQNGKLQFTVTNVTDHTNMTEEQFGKIHGDFKKYNFKKFSKPFEKDGRGVKYVYDQLDENGKLVSHNVVMDRTQDGLIGKEHHGIWYGPGTITKYGPAKSYDRRENPYIMDDPLKSNATFKPVDEVDYMAYLHDRAEDVPGFKSHTEARWLDADINFVASLELFLERAKDPNYIDEVTGRAPSEEAITAANNAIKYFTGNVPVLKGEMPPKAKEKRITMEEVRKRIDARKTELQKDKKKW